MNWTMIKKAMVSDYCRFVLRLTRHTIKI